MLQLTELLALAAGSDDACTKTAEKWKKSIGEYINELKDLKKEANKAAAEAKRLKKFEERKDAVEPAPYQADRVEYTLLCVDRGLILCSITVLTKHESFWWAGILATIVGIGVPSYTDHLPPASASRFTQRTSRCEGRHVSVLGARVFGANVPASAGRA